MRTYTLIFTLLALMIVAGCGGGETSTPAAGTEPAPPAAAASDVQEIVIRPVGDQLKYETESFTVKAGARVKLVMDNVATLPAMQHNVVILQPGADINAVGTAAIQAGPDNQYIPDDPAVLFHTPMAQPGQRVEVEFTAPEAGEYPFICTFPGHYSVMKGVMRVEP